MFTRLFAVAILVSASAAIPAVAARPLGAFGPVLLTAGAAAQTPAVKQVGTIKAINGNTITLATDGGGDVEVTVTETTRIVRVEPGQKDLSGATAMALKDLQVGDRILVRGHSAGDAKSLVAAGIIAMKHADVDAKKQQE